MIIKKSTYSSETIMSEDRHPIYRRRAPEEGENSFFAYRKGKHVTYTNADVVPYNKYLLYKYNYHINVEYCHLVMAIKYHLKYINKGSDEAIINVEGEAANKDSGDTENYNKAPKMKSRSFRTSDM